ncbi:MAG: hypothetical protein IKI65_01655, partial [Firmicutes bacterium]|nr:hypothetical protein [Bacillota bacterium]
MKIRSFIAILLAVLTAVLAPAQAFAAAQPVYVSDVMVGMGETADEAKKALTDAGYTVLDRNVNEGAGSVYKTEKYVYIGYKTTDNADEAITDLAVMNMNGGYSFSDYEVLMNKYRDSQIRPFIDSFLATIEEYRANYNSDIEGNKAKADFAYAILNNIREEDSGSLMGDLLLNPTKEERGLSDEEYKNLPDAEKAKTVNLTTVLMQGNAQIILLIEQTLAMATDTNETTWLERLSELGPEGLMEKYAQAGVRPADANREMASLYDDAAKTILGSWEELRSGLLDYDRVIAETETESVEADADEIDVTEYTQFEIENGEETTVDLLDPEEMVPYYENVMQNSNEIAQEAVDHTFDGIWHVLKEMPYGDGTMYDFFIQPYEDVSGSNISALYPLVSTLTEGQIAAIEFLSATVLAQIGATGSEAYEEFSAASSDLFKGLGELENVSVYYGVNRELFGDKTALTSELLRDRALAEKAFGMSDPLENLGGLSSLTAISWAATGTALLMTAVSAFKYSSASKSFSSLASATDSLYNRLNDHITFCGNIDQTLKPLNDFAEAVQGTDTVNDAAYLMNRVKEQTRYTLRAVQSEGKEVFSLTASVNWDTESLNALGRLSEEGYLDAQQYNDLLNIKDTQTINISSTGEYSDLNLSFKNIDELEDKMQDACNNCSISKSQKFWHGMEIAFGVVFALLAIGSIILTV